MKYDRRHLRFDFFGYTKGCSVPCYVFKIKGQKSCNPTSYIHLMLRMKMVLELGGCMIYDRRYVKFDFENAIGSWISVVLVWDALRFYFIWPSDIILSIYLYFFVILFVKPCFTPFHKLFDWGLLYIFCILFSKNAFL